MFAYVLIKHKRDFMYLHIFLFTHYRLVFVFTTLFVHYITLIFLSYVSSPYSFIFDSLMHFI